MRLIYFEPMRILTGLLLFPALSLAIPLAGQSRHPADVKWTQWEGTDIPVPPSERPRLFLRARDVDDLKRRTTHPVLKPVWDELQKLAEESAQNRMQVDALRYLLTRDRELGKRTIRTAIEALQAANFPPSIPDVTRPVGRMMVAGAIVYDWCYQLLTPEDKKAFLNQFLRLAKQLECGYPPKQYGSVTGHGSEWMIMRDMISAGIAIFDEFPEMYRNGAEIFFKYHLPARNWWYPGHAFHQGTAYAETRFVSDMYPLWIFERLGVGAIYNLSQQFVPYQWIYTRRPDGQLLRAGDWFGKTLSFSSLLCASYYGDGYVLSDYLRNPGVNGMDKLFEFLWRDPNLNPMPISDLPLSRYMGFPYGWMVARTGWDEQSVIAEMKVNIFNFGNHQHHDAGAFQIYHKGPLAIDSGVYEGTGGAYGSPHHQNYYKRTIAHNSLLVYDPDEKFLNNQRREIKNDGGQRLPNGWHEPRTLEDLLTKGYKTAEALAQGFGPDPRTPAYTYLKGDLTEAYSAKVKEVKRSFVFLNLADRATPAALIVFDKVVSANPNHKKYWLLHSMEEPEVEGDSMRVSLSERGWTGRLVNRTLLPERGNTEVVKVGGPGKEYWVRGDNYPSVPRRRKPEEHENGAWRIELSPKVAKDTDYFLNAMQVTDKANSRTFPVERVAGEGLVGVKVADRVVLFRSDAAASQRPASFTVKGAKPLKFLITDLAEGTWQLWRDGQVVMPAVTVTRDAGTLYFEGPGGTYTVRR